MKTTLILLIIMQIGHPVRQLSNKENDPYAARSYTRGICAQTHQPNANSASGIRSVSPFETLEPSSESDSSSADSAPPAIISNKHLGGCDDENLSRTQNKEHHRATHRGQGPTTFTASLDSLVSLPPSAFTQLSRLGSPFELQLRPHPRFTGKIEQSPPSPELFKESGAALGANHSRSHSVISISSTSSHEAPHHKSREKIDPSRQHTKSCRTTSVISILSMSSDSDASQAAADKTQGASPISISSGPDSSDELPTVRQLLASISSKVEDNGYEPHFTIHVIRTLTDFL